MTKSAKRTQHSYNHTWYLQEWAARAGVNQATLAKALNWSKAKGSDVWNGQRYTQELIDEVAPVLHVRPFELLLHPDEAQAIRDMRDDAIRIAARNQQMEEQRRAQPASRPDNLPRRAATPSR